MKKIYYIIFFTILSLILAVLFVLQDSQNTLTLKIKSKIPKETRYFIKNSINSYFNNFGIKFKFVKKSEAKSLKGNIYNLNEYNNKFIDYQGPRSYLDFKNDELFLITGTGIISHGSVKNLVKKNNFKLKSIKSNIKDLVNYNDFFLNSNYGVKGILIDNESIYISIVNEVKKNCYTISILKSKYSLSKLDFKYLFNQDECVKKNNNYGEFQPIQSGGAMSNFDENNFFLTTGEFRYRDHAQSDFSIFGKVLLIDKNNGNYKMISKGHRNSQGIYYDKEKNIIVSTEHGPFGDDEININKDINNNNNFGWPISSYGEHYPKMTPKTAYDKAPLYKSHTQYGFIEPIKYYVPSIGITKILKIKNISSYKDSNNYFFSSMGYADRENSHSIHQIVFDKNYDKIVFEDRIKINHRVRDIIFIPNLKIIVGYLEKRGSIIIITNNEK